MFSLSLFFLIFVCFFVCFCEITIVFKAWRVDKDTNGTRRRILKKGWKKER